MSHAYSAGQANHRGQVRLRMRAAPGSEGIAEVILLTPVAMPPFLVGGGWAEGRPRAGRRSASASSAFSGPWPHGDLQRGLAERRRGEHLRGV